MSLTRNSISIFQRDVLIFISGTITSVLIARKLGPALMGVWSILSLIPIFAESFGRLKFDIASVYFLGKKLFNKNEVIAMLNFIALITSLVIIFPIFIFSESLCRYFFTGSIEYLNLFRLILLQIPFLFFYSNYNYILIATENFAVYNNMVLIRVFFATFGSVIALYLFNVGLVWLLIISISSLVVSVLYSHLFFSFGRRTIFPSLNMFMVKTFFKYSINFYISGIITNLNTYLIRSLLALYLIPSQLAYYSIAQDRVSLLSKVSDSICPVIFAKMSKENLIEEKVLLTIKAIRVSLSALLLFSLLFSLFIYPFVYILYGIDYLPIIPPFLIFIPAIYATSGLSILIQYFNSIGNSRKQTLIFLAILFFQTLLFYLVRKNVTVINASIIFSISNVIVFLSTLYFFLLKNNCKLNVVLPIRNDFETIINLGYSKFFILISPTIKIFKKLK